MYVLGRSRELVRKDSIPLPKQGFFLGSLRIERGWLWPLWHGSSRNLARFLLGIQGGSQPGAKNWAYEDGLSEER